jgi:sulfite reductase (ferredoxin)
MLLKKDVIVNTQNGILRDFETQYGGESRFQFPEGFKEFVLRINKHEPTKEFAQLYLHDAKQFLETITSTHPTEDSVETEARV